MITVDLDRFNQVVRYFGPTVGDEVLSEVRARLARLSTPQMSLSRLSADMFALLLDGMPLAPARELGLRILDAIGQQPFDIQGRSFTVTARIAVVELQAPMSAADVLAACDAGLVQARENGGNCLVAYAAGDPVWQRYQRELHLMSELRERIPFERLFMVYQPIVALQEPQRSLNYEALLRLREKDGRIVSPGDFMPALEKAGLMSQTDRWVVREMFAFLERNPEHFARLSYASINLSGASLNDDNFVAEIVALASEHPQTVQKICFELTESVALAHLRSTKRFIETLKSLGARIALDDFGAGYSSFAYLTQLNVDYVKIDGSLIKDLENNLRNQIVVRSVVSLARELGMQVVAEWAENARTVQLLRNMGVDSVQGWALSRPLEAPALLQGSHGLSYVQDIALASILLAAPEPDTMREPDAASENSVGAPTPPARRVASRRADLPAA